MHRFREVSLLVLSNTSQTIETIGLNCPLIEQLSVSRMSNTGKNETLEKMTQMNKLIRLDITNNVDGMTLDNAFTLQVFRILLLQIQEMVTFDLLLICIKRPIFRWVIS